MIISKHMVNKMVYQEWDKGYERGYYEGQRDLMKDLADLMSMSQETYLDISKLIEILNERQEKAEKKINSLQWRTRDI